MKKRSLVWLALLLSLLLPLVTACADSLPQEGSNSLPAARPAGNELYVLDNYPSVGHKQLPQHLVALPTGATNPTAQLTLPAGLTDLKHQRLYLANPLSHGKGNVHTSIS